MVIGILQKKDQFLIAQRPPNKPYSGYWEFPGGKIEADESSFQALLRELREELGVVVLSADFLFQHAHDYPDKTVLLDVWQVNAFHGEPHGKEGQVLNWVSWSEMKTYQVLEGNQHIIKRVEIDLRIRSAI